MPRKKGQLVKTRPAFCASGVCLAGLNRGLFDQQGIHVAHTEVGIQRYGAGDGDLVVDLGGLFAGDDQIVAVLAAGAILNVDEVAAHDAVVHFYNFAADGDLLAFQTGELFVDGFNGLGGGGHGAGGDQGGQAKGEGEHDRFHRYSLRWSQMGGVSRDVAAGLV